MGTERMELWTPEQREIWRGRSKMSVSEWADANVVLPQKTTAEHGRFRTDRNPIVREIQDTFIDPGVSTISICGGTQWGKTQTILNWIGYCIDQDPSPMIFGLPDENICKRVSGQRVRPFIEATPCLAKYIPADRNRFSLLEYDFDSMVLNYGWSGSPASLSSMAARRFLGDEIDKWKLWSGRDAGPLALAEERKRTFWDGMTVLTSTPTDEYGAIWLSLAESDWRRYWVPCVLCGKFQTLRFANVIWDGGREAKADQVRRHKTARYLCEGCRGEIEDTRANHMRMLLAGVWAPTGCEVDADSKGVAVVLGERPDTDHAGFHTNACYSAFSSWSSMAAKFLRSFRSRDLLMNFTNAWEGMPFVEKVAEPQDATIRATMSGYREGTAPEGAVALFATVDVQSDHFWCVIRAWGAQEESWLVRAVPVESWDQLDAVVFRTAYPVGRGTMPVSLVLIDSRYRGDEVTTWAHQWLMARPPREVRLTFGVPDIAKGQPLRVSTVDHHPRTGQKIPGGLQKIEVNTGHFKDKLARFIETGIWHTHDGLSEGYCRQMTSEKKVMKRKGDGFLPVWVPVGDGVPNHLWDCEVLQMVAAHVMHCWSWTAPGQELTVARSGELEGSRREREEKWIQPRRGYWGRR